MILIIVDTSNFTFMATGKNRLAARQALADGWKKHCEQYEDADPNYVNPRTDGNVYDLLDGQCWRDDTLIFQN